MKYLITGGAGYVGSVLTPRLLSAGHEVVVIDNLRYGGEALLPCISNPGFTFVRGDIHDASLVRSCVEKVDVVVHLAAIVGFPACRKYPALAETTNVQGTRNVALALRKDQVLVYASTGSSYGKLDEICTEESPLNPVSLYGITKGKGEEIALNSKASATALRFATAYGVSPRFRLDLLVNDFVHQAVVNKQIIVYERHFRRTFIHVRDIARSIQFAAEHIDAMDGLPFNVGHESQNHTKEDIANKIRERIPFYLHYAEIGSDPDKRDYEVSYEKIRSVGFETEVTLDAGIDELIRATNLLEVVNPFTNM